jgi:hypothetical protein
MNQTITRIQHTPTPWRWVDRSEHSDLSSADSEIPFGIEHVSDVVRGVEPIADICNFPPATPDQTARQRANAEFIVRAVNNFDGLVEALETAVYWSRHSDVCATANANRCDCWKGLAQTVLTKAGIEP